MKKPLLILDLDETLIYASKVVLPVKHDFKCCDFFVYKRPFLDQFIATCQENFETAVWTSATSDYAECITSEIFPKSSLAFLWSREKCTRRYDFELQEHYWVKDLKKVKRTGFDLKQILFIDNTAQKLERNYGNLVLVKDFEGNQQDQELLELAHYLLNISDESDFKTIEKRSWRDFKNSNEKPGE